MDYEIKPVDGVKSVKGARYRLHRPHSMRGMYYRKLVNRICTPYLQTRKQQEAEQNETLPAPERRILDIQA